MDAQRFGNVAEDFLPRIAALHHLQYILLATWQYWHITQLPTLAIIDMYQHLATQVLGNVADMQISRLAPAQARCSQKADHRLPMIWIEMITIDDRTAGAGDLLSGAPGKCYLAGQRTVIEKQPQRGPLNLQGIRTFTVGELQLALFSGKGICMRVQLGQ